MDPQMMEQMHAKLLNRREIALGRRQRLLAERRQLLERGAAQGNELADDRNEAARLEGLARLETHTLDRIDASLARMTMGTYGQCLHCHGAIETERLRAMPDVSCCAGCTR